MRTHYITTDLGIECPVDPQPIVDHFGEDVLVQYQAPVGGVFRASFTLATTLAGVNEAIDAFCMLIESLDDAARSLWDSCTRIDFDLGYASGDGPKLEVETDYREP